MQHGEDGASKKKKMVRQTPFSYGLKRNLVYTAVKFQLPVPMSSHEAKRH